MQQYRKGTHTVHDIKYHFVWITKYRYKILKGDLGLRIRDLIREVCMACDCKILTGSVGTDHVHVLVSVPPNMAPSKLVQYMKGKTSHKVQQEFPAIRKQYWGQHIWARGYFCASSGTVTDEIIKEYIENQSRNFNVEDGFKIEQERL